MKYIVDEDSFLEKLPFTGDQLIIMLFFLVIALLLLAAALLVKKSILQPAGTSQGVLKQEESKGHSLTSLSGKLRLLSKRAGAIILLLLLALLLIFGPYPRIAFGAPGDPENLVVEYRYSDGESSPNIPATVTQFGREYRLILTSDAVLESSLPIMRTYTFSISGSLTEAQLADVTLIPNINITPVEIVFEREVDKTEALVNLPTNDVEDLASSKDFVCTSAADPSGYASMTLERAGVEFLEPTKDSFGLPTGYSALVVYRGVETYSDIGYYNAEATYETETEDGETNSYIIVAEYEPVEAAEIPGAETPLSELPGSELTVDEEMFANQTGNLIQDILDGNVPLGGPTETNAWSVTSLVEGTVGILLAFIAMVVSFTKKMPLLESGRRKKNRILVICAIIAGILPILAWLVLDDMALPIVWINSFTPIITLVFAIAAVMFVVALVDTVSAGKDIKSSERDETAHEGAV